MKAMSENNIQNPGKTVEIFPYRIVIIRWLLALMEMGIATYFVLTFKFYIGLLFLAYGIICVTVLLPMIRCVRCGYYGRRCNFGIGSLVANIFPRANDSRFSSRYGYSFLFWPLRLIPIGFGMIKMLSLTYSPFRFVPHGLFIVYLLLILLHRGYYRTSACPKCQQRAVCPVYDIAVMRGNTGDSDSVIG